MATVIQRGKSWWAYWKQNGATKGKRTNIRVRQEGKSINETRALALQIANLYERAAKGLTPIEVLEANLRAVAATNGYAAPVPSITAYLDSVPPTSSASSERNRRRAFAVFREFLGERTELPLTALTYAMCRDFVVWDLKRVRQSTVAQHRGYISTALRRAFLAERYIDRNPMELVTVGEVAKALGRTDDRITREPFTPEELRRLMTEAPAPWCDMVAVSFYLAGLRISDVVTLAWSSVDFERNLVRLREVKTSRERTLALRPELRERLLRIRAGQEGGKRAEEYVFPEMARRYLWRNGAATISPMFSALLRAMGIVPAADDGALQRGFSHRCSTKSFHSIRHAVVSIAREDPTLTADVVRETVGHSSELVERGYFHLTNAGQQRVLSALAAAVAG